LRKKAKPVRRVDDALIRFIEDMFDTMHSAGGIGLAANQVGSLDRVLVVDVSEMEETKDLKPMVLLNAELASEIGALQMEEGCLSIPDIRSEVERAEKVLVRYKDLEFKDQQLEASGLLARVIMHEIDHLNGVLFIDHIASEEVKLLRGRLNKIRRGECEVKYPIVAESLPTAKVESK
jgi:peptide deformylase